MNHITPDVILIQVLVIEVIVMKNGTFKIIYNPYTFPLAG